MEERQHGERKSPRYPQGVEVLIFTEYWRFGLEG
jgi:hypothetical protein